MRYTRIIHEAVVMQSGAAHRKAWERTYAISV